MAWKSRRTIEGSVKTIDKDPEELRNAEQISRSVKASRKYQSPETRCVDTFRRLNE